MATRKSASHARRRRRSERTRLDSAARNKTLARRTKQLTHRIPTSFQLFAHLAISAPTELVGSSRRREPRHRGSFGHTLEARSMPSKLRRLVLSNSHPHTSWVKLNQSA